MSEQQPLVGALLSLADSILALDQKISSFMSTTNARLGGVEGRLLQLERKQETKVQASLTQIQTHRQKPNDVTTDEIASLERRLAALRKTRTLSDSDAGLPAKHQGRPMSDSDSAADVRKWIDEGSNNTSNVSNN